MKKSEKMNKQFYKREKYEALAAVLAHALTLKPTSPEKLKEGMRIAEILKLSRVELTAREGLKQTLDDKF